MERLILGLSPSVSELGHQWTVGQAVAAGKGQDSWSWGHRLWNLVFKDNQHPTVSEYFPAGDE